jgi:hypothetical protein
VPEPSPQLSHVCVLIHSSASNDSDVELGVMSFLLVLHDSVLHLLILLSLRPLVVTCDLFVESSLSLLDIRCACKIRMSVLSTLRMEYNLTWSNTARLDRTSTLNSSLCSTNELVVGT